MVNGLLVSNGMDVSRYSSNPFINTGSDFMSSSIGVGIDSSLFSSVPGLDLSSYFTGDILSTILLFNLTSKNNFSGNFQNLLLNKSYNTRTDLPGLKDVYNPEVSSRLANIAETNARRTNTVGWCAKGTNDSLEAASLVNKGETRVYAAYQEADKLENLENFKEVYVAREDLKNLPAGCVICWNKGTGRGLSNSYGHIAITLGDGKEASDHVSDMNVLNSEYRVFVPIQPKKVDLAA